MNEPNKAVQDEELDALRAIFGDDWHDIAPGKTAWGTDGETGWWEVLLHATDDPRVSVKLKGRMTKHYPSQPPPISLLDPVKLTAAHVRTLTKLVQDKAKASVGAPMIFDLTDMVQGWITDNHVPLPKPGEPEPTLMEEMALREEAQRAAEEAFTQAEKAKRKAQEAEKFRVLNEKILQDTSRKEERNRRAQADEAAKERQEKLQGLADGELELRELTLREPISIDGYDGPYASWALFAGRREALWTSYTGEPAGGGPGFVSASIPTVTVQVIDFSTPYYQGTHGRKRIDALVSEVNRIKDVRSPNVARVYAVQRAKSPKGWERVIIVVERTAEGGRLSTWLPKYGFGEEKAKEYLLQILCGLSDLHRAHAMQKQLDADLILLSPGDEGEVVAKLAGTSYARRITEYHRSNPFLKSQEESFPESWLSPDEIESPYNYSPKRDVWHAGLILLQMLFGRRCLWTYRDLHTLLQHSSGGISGSLMDLLSGLLNPSHKKRLTAEEALSRLRAPDEEMTSRPDHRRPSTMAMDSQSSSTPIAEQFGKSPVFGRLGSYFPPPPTPGGAPSRYSRYRSDFEEVEFLGKGGFGEVVKARNKLDGRPYAIKKVKLRPEDNESRVLREVNSLSRVSHQHIVRYYSCWLEEVAPPTRSPTDESSHPTPTATSSDNEDIFAVNFDDMSFSRRDRSRSASFPRIRFTNDSDDEDDDDSDDDGDDGDDSHDYNSDSDGTIPDPSASDARAGRSKVISVPSKPSNSYTNTTTDDESVQRILYIQMEFVEKQTLREAISSGLSEDEAWRLLVQILQALAHMSSLGIVHRDLKPSNILLDANGNVKIADFGLSTTDLGNHELITAGVNTSGDFSDRTSNIGTSLYIAPEVIVSKSYNEKADMYSLGIIFFEMCFAFKTGMERVQTLTALRSSSVPLQFPAAWLPGQKSRQREIINLLLRHDPATRPQATQLLTGPLVPTIDKEEKFYDDVINEITNPRSEKYTSLVEALFDSRTNSFNVDNRIDDYTYDNDHDDAHYVWLTVVVRRIVDVFQRHGAVDDYLPLLIPETTLLNAFPERAPVRLLDANGKFVQLPASNLLAMARSASRRQIERIKRYVVGRQYSELPAGGQPGTHWELCFDIVSPIRSLCAEAELLELADKIVTECQGSIGGSTHAEYEFHISHETVLAIILSATPVQVRPRVLKAFKGPSTGVSFGYGRPSLSSIPGLPKALVQDLEQCTVADDFDILRHRIENTFTASRTKLKAALDEIATVIRLTRMCGVRRKVLFRPTLSKNAEYFRGGFMFECVRRGKQSEVVAFGGRSDSLLEHFKEPATQMQSRKGHAVCMSVSADQLTRMVRKYESALSTRLMEKTKVEERSFGFWSPARCDVYVSSTPQVDINDRLTLVSELWRAGIRADLQYDDGRGLQDVIDECLEQNILYLVIARGHKSAFKVVRTLTGRTSEEEVDADKLAAWLKTGIADQRRIDQAYAEGAAPVVKDRDTVETAVSRIDADIKLVLPPEPFTSRPSKGKPVRKHRHATKTLYYDKAVEFVTSVSSTLPVLGVDLAPELLSQLALDTTWVTDDEAWRTITHSQPTSERSYSEQVRKAVIEHHRSQGGNCWLFSVRDARGFLLQLCR